MRTAIVVAAVVTFAMMMIVMIASCSRIICEIACNQCGNRCIGTAFDTAVKLDAGLCECILCTGTDTAADQNIYAERRKHTGECTVTAAKRIDHFHCDDAAVFDTIKFKLFAVTKMLEDLAVFIRYCNFHVQILLLYGDGLSGGQVK